MRHYVSWEIVVEDASSPLDAAQQAYDHFMRPGSIAHVFDVVDDAGDGEEVDLDETEGGLGYPASERERIKLESS